MGKTMNFINPHQVSLAPHSIGLADEVTVPVVIPDYVASDREFKVRGFAGTWQGRELPYQGLAGLGGCNGQCGCEGCGSGLFAGMGLLHLVVLGGVVWWMAKEHGTWRY